METDRQFDFIDDLTDENNCWPLHISLSEYFYKMLLNANFTALVYFAFPCSRQSKMPSLFLTTV